MSITNGNGRRRQMQDRPHEIISKPSDEKYEKVYEHIFGERKPTYLMTEEELDGRVCHIRMEEDVHQETQPRRGVGDAICQRELNQSRNRVFMSH